MSPIHIDHARSRITDLRARLADISEVLRDALAEAQGLGGAEPAKLEVSIRALQAVSADLEGVCDEHLTDLKEHSEQQAAALRARSEVASGEFDAES